MGVYRLSDQQVWDIGFHSYASRIGSKNNYVASLSKKQAEGFHSYASRIGSKFQNLAVSIASSPLNNVSIHTLHELEARTSD